MRAKFGVLEQTQGLRLHAIFHLNVFIVSASGGQKPQFWANFDTGWFLYRPLLPMRAKFSAPEQTCNVWLRAKFRLDRFILSPSVAEKPLIFAVFWTSAFCDIDSWRQSEKVEHRCTATKFSLSNSIKLVSVLQRLHSEIWRTISDVQKRDGQTDRQTKKLNVFGRPRGG